MNEPAIIVHVGWGNVEPSSMPERLKAVEQAAQAGWRVMLNGGSAVDAVEAAVLVLEDNRLFNAGIGSALNSEGRIETDAAIMDGSSLSSGAVAAVTAIRNPIQLARRLMEVGPPVFLVAGGAEQFARSQGIPKCEVERLFTQYRRQEWEDAHGTVGASACDEALEQFEATFNGEIGMILVDRLGQPALARNSRVMPTCAITANGVVTSS